MDRARWPIKWISSPLINECTFDSEKDTRLFDEKEFYICKLSQTYYKFYEKKETEHVVQDNACFKDGMFVSSISIPNWDYSLHSFSMGKQSYHQCYGN